MVIIEKAILDKTVSAAIIDHDAADELLERLKGGSLPSPSKGPRPLSCVSGVA